MKKIVLIFSVLLAVSCSNGLQTTYNAEGDVLFLVITKNTTKRQLDDIVLEFQKKSKIEISYSNSNFDDKGNIIQLELAVDCNDGHKGKTTINKTALQSDIYGFVRDYSPEAEEVFIIGKFEIDRL